MVLLAAAALVDVTITPPRVAVRWHSDVTDAQRRALEDRYDLLNGEPDGSGAATSTWRYDVGDDSQENIGALLDDPAVDDTAAIDRVEKTVPARDVAVRLREVPLEWLEVLLDARQSYWLIAAGLLLLRAARATSRRVRCAAACVALLAVGAAAFLLPLDPAGIRMGEVRDRLSRDGFEAYYTGKIRFEKHLSQIALFMLYQHAGPTEDAPELAMQALGRLGAIWFVACAALVGTVEAWSPSVLRYLALTVMAPATLLYFGWLEFAYLSLGAATFPLLARGLRTGTGRLEAGSVFAGIGAALHGVGLLALAGAGLAALGAAGRSVDRLARALRVVAWGTAAHLGWIAIYVTALGLSVEPQDQPGVQAPGMWRPLITSEIREHRVSAAVLSATGGRDLLMEAAIVGLPLAIAAAFVARRYPEDARAAFWYLLPSLAFLVFRWPYTGVGPGMDLVVAGFPALYALAWVCAQESRASSVAAALLAIAHAAFWWAVLDQRFAVGRID